jgi:hypothetical protein
VLTTLLKMIKQPRKQLLLTSKTKKLQDLLLEQARKMKTLLHLHQVRSS